LHVNQFRRRSVTIPPNRFASIVYDATRGRFKTSFRGLAKSAIMNLASGRNLLKGASSKFRRRIAKMLTGNLRHKFQRFYVLGLKCAAKRNEQPRGIFLNALQLRQNEGEGRKC
jgi:hypothetical protein